MSVHTEVKRITTHILQEMKNRGEKISCLTAYDYSMARIVDAAGVDLILVGDSASNVMAGHETTLPITLDQMIYHAASVVKAVKRALVVVDIPFGSYQGNSTEALRSAIRIMKESGGHAVKMEGGSEIKESIVRVLSAGIPVMGHLGLTPQSIYKFGTYTVRAKEEEEAKKLLEAQFNRHICKTLMCSGNEPNYNYYIKEAKYEFRKTESNNEILTLYYNYKDRNGHHDFWMTHDIYGFDKNNFPVNRRIDANVPLDLII